MHQNAELLFRRYAASQVTEKSRVLEIGPDAIPSTLQQAAPKTAVWSTADLATSDSATTGQMTYTATVASKLTYVMPDEYALDVAPGAYDVIVAANVIEHVRMPWRWISMLAAVLPPRGCIILICPVSWPYHPAPVDCWRIFPEGMRALFESVGLETELAVCESLEPARGRRSYPGASLSFGWDNVARRSLRRPLAVSERLKGLVGWPLPTPLDTLAVGRRP